MMHCLKSSLREPEVPCTSSEWGPVNRPVPRITSTLRCLASVSSPPVSRETTRLFHARSLSKSSAGGPNEMPLSAISFVSSITLAAWSSALDGMQPTFRHTPPSVGHRSINVTLSPRSAARNAAV